jgi:hypothetical protein
MSMKNSNDIGNRTRGLPACSAVPQPTAPPRVSIYTDGKLRGKEFVELRHLRQIKPTSSVTPF